MIFMIKLKSHSQTRMLIESSSILSLKIVFNVMKTLILKKPKIRYLRLLNT
ncbi:hypothetical protein BN1326_60462 [Staphylococcus argenteus]|uniref:Uncharacterized protein n=1 Tax=Staphylococcus argenteus TaxID=985002 RepID=A0A7U7JUK7_9STAP|nr:hypothetical protein BN1326_60462 [Staphylococcus argenteus]CRI27243.1 hypothetical protein BN1326_60462 [Staphylococcus argenteus]